MREKEIKELKTEIKRIRKDLTEAQKQIARIKIVLKDAHLMSLDD